MPKFDWLSRINLSDMAKRMMLVVCALLPVLIAGSAIYYRSLSFLPFALGAVMGTALGAAKIVMLDRMVSKVVGMEPARAGNYVRVQQLLRLLLTGIVLVIAALVPFISLWGAAAGVLTYQIAVYSLKWFQKRDAGAVGDDPQIVPRVDEGGDPYDDSRGD